MDRLFEIGGGPGPPTPPRLPGFGVVALWARRDRLVRDLPHSRAPFTDERPRLVETALATRVSGITVRLVAGHVPVVAGAGRRIHG